MNESENNQSVIKLLKIFDHEFAAFAHGQFNSPIELATFLITYGQPKTLAVKLSNQFYPSAARTTPDQVKNLSGDKKLLQEYLETFRLSKDVPRSELVSIYERRQYNLIPGQKTLLESERRERMRERYKQRGSLKEGYTVYANSGRNIS